jgi:hypothetical protein
MSEEITWRKSSRSGTGGNACVELAVGRDQTSIRDSTLGDTSPVLAFHAIEFGTFLAAINSGKYDLR